MIVIEKNVGPKIFWEEFGNKVCFDDDLTINLAKREEDDPVHIDVCYDQDKNLVICEDFVLVRRYAEEHIEMPAGY